MKVILLENVPKLGRKLDIVKVSDGYARNFLFASKKAERATPEKIKIVQEKLKDNVVKKEEMLANANLMIQKFDKKSYEIEEKVSDKGHLFGSVTAHDLAELINKKEKIELDKEHVLLEKPIKEVGEHKIKIQLTDDAEGEVTLVIKGIEEK